MPKVGLREFKTNPLLLTCSVFFFLAPFLTWMTVLTLVIVKGFVVTGFAVQSNLWDIANLQAGIPVTKNLALSSLAAAILLILTGLTILKDARIGLPIATAGLTIFAIASYPIFGKIQNGLATAFISPGIGFFLALVATILGVISTQFENRPIGILARDLRSKEGLTRMGLFLAAVPLLLDGLNHAALGQFSDFLGSTATEQTLHLGFMLSIVSLLIAVAVHQRVNVNAWVPRIAVMTFIFLISDAIYHALTGEIQAFIGHNSIEIVLHIAIYYGVALVMIGRVLLRR